MIFEVLSISIVFGRIWSFCWVWWLYMNKRGEGIVGKSLEGCEEILDFMDRVLFGVWGFNVCFLVE